MATSIDRLSGDGSAFVAGLSQRDGGAIAPRRGHIAERRGQTHECCLRSCRALLLDNPVQPSKRLLSLRRSPAVLKSFKSKPRNIWRLVDDPFKKRERKF